MKAPEYIHPPIEKSVLKKELTKERFVRSTGKGENEVYIFTGDEAPNLLKEVGRLREWSFALAGGGTGKPLDLDDQDRGEKAYSQLIVWSPEEEEIVGGYRFIDCKDIGKDEIDQALSTSHYFKFSSSFISDFLPYTIELGRSFVQPAFQPNIDPRKGIFALDNLWDGLGAIVNTHPHMKYFFGKVTMYTDYNREARNAVLAFMHHYFPDGDGLVKPVQPLPYEEDSEFISALEGSDFKDGLRLLTKYCKERKEMVPPLIKNYMQLSPSMKTFGTFMNKDFGKVEETGILVTIEDIYPDKKERYL